MRYRTHIDGLRALAVTSVIAFHASEAALPGGFIGVDVFFVISGFLISKVIYSDVERLGHVDLVSFYERRARRILPAFAAVTVGVLLVGALRLLPEAFSRLASSALYATGFAANVHFYSTSGYFEPSALSQPLLHLWSLGVEEQFYIVFPLLVAIAWKVSGRFTPIVVVVIAVASLVGSEHIVQEARWSEAFYLPHLRAWELLAGSVLALPRMPFPKTRLVGEGLSVIGLALIALSTWTLQDNAPFPGLSALPAVLGTSLVLLGCDVTSTFVGRALSVRPIVAFGKWSYSVYLVHWPFVAFGALEAVPPGLRIGALFGISVVLGGLSYRWVERPFRENRVYWNRRRLFGASAIALTTLALAAGVVRWTDGFPGRLPPRVRHVLSFDQFSNGGIAEKHNCFQDLDEAFDDLDLTSCLNQAPGKRSALLWGDSHALGFHAVFAPHLEKHGYQLGMIAASFCPPAVRYTRKVRPTCRSFNDRALDLALARNVDLVILAALWIGEGSELSHLEETIRRLSEAKVRTVLIGALPYYEQRVPQLLARRLLDGDENALSGNDLTQAVFSLDLEMKKRFGDRKDVHYVSALDAMCDARECLMAGTESVPFHWDNSHLTLAGAQFLMDRLVSRGALANAIP